MLLKHRNRRALSIVAATLALAAASLLHGADSTSQPAEPTAEQKQFFSLKIRPVLEQNCFACHGNGKHKGGLRLDSREAILKGGDDGVVVVVGKPDESQLIQSVKWQAKDKDLNMPPEGKKPRLSAEQIANWEKWVEMGLPWEDKK